MRPVQAGLGGGRAVVPSRHGHKGGGRRRGWYKADGRCCLQPRGNHGCGVSRRDAEALRGPQHGQEAVLLYMDGQPYAVVTFDIDEGRIRAVYNQLNPDKLRNVPRLQ